jgi:hypothetical protein
MLPMKALAMLDSMYGTLLRWLMAISITMAALQGTKSISSIRIFGATDKLNQ